MALYYGSTKVCPTIKGNTPSGTVTITTNGVTSVTDYATADVNVQPTLQTKTVITNVTVTPDEGYDGLSSVTVNVPNGTESKTITTNGTYTPTSPNIGFNEVIINVEGGITPTGTVSISSNGTTNVTNYATAVVNVQPTLQAKTATTNTTVVPDSGYDGLSSVVVNVQEGSPIVIEDIQGILAQEWSINTEDISDITAYTHTDNGNKLFDNNGTQIGEADFSEGEIMGGTITVEGTTYDIIDGSSVGSPVVKPKSGVVTLTRRNTSIAFSTDATAITNLAYVFGASFTDDIDVTVIAPKITAFNAPYVTAVDTYGMYYTFCNCTSLASVDLGSLTTVSNNSALHSAFLGCTSLTSVDLGSLTTINGNSALGNAFNGCTSLTSIDLSSLITASGYFALFNAFCRCTSLTSIDLSSLTTISGDSALRSAFYGCTSLTSIDLSSLTNVSGSQALYSAFLFCTSLTSLSFPSLTSTSFGSYTNQFDNMLHSVTGCTVHFPSNLQSVIGSWSSVTGGFDGTNTTVLFDLPATT